MSGSNIAPVVAPMTADGTATATPKISVAKVVRGGSWFFAPGSEITYDITAGCYQNTPVGVLYHDDNVLTDQLPTGVTYVSSNPAAIDNGDGTLTWLLPDAGRPSSCGGLWSSYPRNDRTFEVKVKVPDDAPEGTTIVNGATFSGTPHGRTIPISASSNVTVTVSSNPDPWGPGSTVKSGFGPLGNLETFAGNWITPIAATPHYSANFKVEAGYHVSAQYAAPGFEVGASFTCTATLSALHPGELHTDVVTVRGSGQYSGLPVQDDDSWGGRSRPLDVPPHPRPPEPREAPETPGAPGTPGTPVGPGSVPAVAGRLPVTGAALAGPAGVGIVMVLAGAVLVGARRRSARR